MEDGLPFRVIDRTSRNLFWVMINDNRANTDKEFYNSHECHIIVCPRPDGPGQPQDIISRPCFNDGKNRYFRLKDEVHSWLLNAGLERAYQFEYRYTESGILGWYVGFLDKAQAALFKLAWAP